jgi:hypothetical protein
VPLRPAHAAFTPLTLSGQPLLQRYFGGALAILNSPELLAHFNSLCATGVSLLLESDEFKTDSESSVLLLLQLWMDANYDRTTEEARRRLAGTIRLVQLSRCDRA